MTTPTQTMSIQEVAIFCRAEAETIAQYARSGELPGTKMGKGWVFLHDDVVAFLRERISDETQQRRAKASSNSTHVEPTAVQLTIPVKKRRTALPRLPLQVDK